MGCVFADAAAAATTITSDSLLTCVQARHVQTINEKKQAMNANLTKTQVRPLSCMHLQCPSVHMIVAVTPAARDALQAFESYYDQKHDVTVRAPTAMGR